MLHFATADQDAAGHDSKLYDDFYKRNPAALANGWLALPHHRNVPDVDSREQRREEAMTKLARELVRAAQTRLSDLVVCKVVQTVTVNW